MRRFSELIAMEPSPWIRMAFHSTSTASPAVLHESQNSHEDTKDTKTTMGPLRISSPLPDDLERLVERVIGACIAVHAELGPGLLEATYSKAIAVELTELGISFELERSFPVTYKGVVIGYHRLDLLIEGQIVVEVKAVERLLPVHVAQTICYLKVSKARVGLLMNFNAEVLRSGLRRIVL